MAFSEENLKISKEILTLIAKSQNILLHLHPSPDGDSLGSTLALFHYLQGQHKSVTLIKGDSALKNKSAIFPGIDKITSKNLFEVDIDQYDLFIILDSSSPGQVSKLGDTLSFIKKIKTVAIDHHPTNEKFADINLVIPQAAAASEIVYDLFKDWHVRITPDIATCLFLGIFSDTGGFTNINVTPDVFTKCGTLSKKIYDLPSVIFEFSNYRNINEINFIKLALSKYKVYFSGKVALSAISYRDLVDNDLNSKETSKEFISSFLRSNPDWHITICLAETEPDKCEISMRSRVPSWDVSLIAKQLQGGGHKVAAGATLNQSFDHAVQSLLKVIQDNYKDLGDP